MPKDLSILRNSEDPKLLVNTAVEFAASELAPDHAALIPVLNSHAFLGRLNTKHEYDTLPTKQLRVAKVVKVLRDSPHEAAKLTLIRLSKGGPFIDDNWRREELLVRALVNVRPATPPVIAFWDEQSKTTAVNRHIAIEMMCENRSAPALELFERKLIDPKQEQIYKISWIHAFMLKYRNDLQILLASERMITQTLPPELRVVVLETLCSYDLRWYAGCQRPNAPSRLPIEAPARQVLGRICRHAKANMELDPFLALNVEATYREIGSPE